MPTFGTCLEGLWTLVSGKTSNYRNFHQNLLIRMRRFGVFFLALFLTSCQYFISNEDRAVQLADEKMVQIDMNTVEQFPLYPDCDENASKLEQQDCFQKLLMVHLKNAIKDTKFQSEENIKDTLWIDLKIDEKGYISAGHIFKNQTLDLAIPELKDSITKRLNDFTKIEPALKRGVPVSMKVRLPLLVETEN